MTEFGDMTPLSPKELLWEGNDNDEAFSAGARHTYRAGLKGFGQVW